MNQNEHNLTRLVLQQADELAKEIGLLQQAILNLPHCINTDLATGRSSITIEVTKQLRESLESGLLAMLESMLESSEEKYEELTPTKLIEDEDEDHDDNDKKSN